MIGRSIKNLLINDLAIDLGTVNTLVYLSGRGIILNEPSTLATNKYTSEVVALGRAAERMFGREPFGVAVHHPLKDGTIAEFDLAAKLIKGLLCQAGLRGRKYGYATEPEAHSTLQVIGKSIDGIPQVVEVCAVHVMQALDSTIQAILSGVHCVFKQAPPDVAHEINRSGIILTGGGSLIRNLEKRFADELGIPIQRAENPLEAVILGAGQFVENPGLFGKFNIMSEVPDWDLVTDAYTLHDNEKHEAKSSIV